MLEQINLKLKLSKQEYRERRPALQRRLHQVQQACWEANLASLLVFEGWDASGKGAIIRKLTERLEPRGFDLHNTSGPRTYELQLPWLGRFWAKLPNYGHMAIFNRSWYGRVLGERVEGLTPPEQWRQAYGDITSFERALADDRHEVIKFFLHISKQEQGRRLKKLQNNKRTSWQVAPEDWERHQKYDEYQVAVEEMLERTGAEWAPWTVVESTDRKWAQIKVFETVICHLEGGLKRRGYPVPEDLEEPSDDDESSDPGDDEEVDD